VADRIYSFFSTAELLAEGPTGRQIAAARTLAGLSQPDLAKSANISAPTLKRTEASEGPAVGMANNVAAVRAALEAAGVEFIPANGSGAGVRLRKEKFQ
jgi:transcriptional regulator with XRE-family HTH domain